VDSEFLSLELWNSREFIGNWNSKISDEFGNSEFWELGIPNLEF
jgi:hypothetical protein